MVHKDFYIITLETTYWVQRHHYEGSDHYVDDLLEEIKVSAIAVSPAVKSEEVVAYVIRVLNPDGVWLIGKDSVDARKTPMPSEGHP